MQQKADQIRYTAFEQTHVFKCEVNGRPLMAVIRGEYKLNEQFGYQVNFSDGFQAMFIAGGEGWICRREGRHHLDAIHDELNRFVAMQVNNFINAGLISH